jgi:hypothetical protein
MSSHEERHRAPLASDRTTRAAKNLTAWSVATA